LLFSLKETYLLDAIEKELAIPVVQVLPAEKYKITQFSKVPNQVNGSYVVQSRSLSFLESIPETIDWNLVRQRVIIQGKEYRLSRVLSLPNYKDEPQAWIFAFIDISERLAEIRSGIVMIVLMSIGAIFLATCFIARSYGTLIDEIDILNQCCLINNQ